MVVVGHEVVVTVVDVVGGDDVVTPDGAMVVVDNNLKVDDRPMGLIDVVDGGEVPVTW
jgi:hypothetical protein